jgi:flagellar biosynthesis/type III secretory pathway M-ring protein FliF/YscJ
VEPSLLPTPPQTDDPVTWIALALVIALVSILGAQLRGNAKERKEERAAARTEREQAAAACRAEREAALTAFREELAAQRATNLETLGRLDDRNERRAAAIHKRFDCITEDLTKVVAKLDAA